MRRNIERTLAWNDPDLKIDWELEGEPIVSAKDQRGRCAARCRNLRIAAGKSHP